MLKGIVTDKYTNKAIPYSNIFLQQTDYGTNTDQNGEFIIENISPGLYNIEISFIGYKRKVLYEIEINNKMYFTDNEDNGDIYENIDGELGEIIGKIINKNVKC